MSEDFEYKAFLSYSHQDKKWGAWLHKQLEKYRTPKNLKLGDGSVVGNGRTIGRIFRDRDELPAAEDLTEAVEKALKSSEYLIVLCSPASAASVWVNKEVIEFKRLRGDRFVLPIIIEGEPFGSDKDMPELECFPPAVRFKIGKNGSLSTIAAEPAAADARKGADGKQRAVLKLLAGLLGVGLDQLVEREMRRRHKRVMTITAGALIGMIVMAGLTVEAMRAREAADRHRAEAEDLVEFMLTDLREKLEPVGRLDVLDAVGGKVLSYHDNAEQYDDASDDDIGRRARAYHLLAEMEYRRGKMDDAQTMFEQAAEATGELLKRDPNNTQRIFEHAQSVFWVGNMDFERGNFVETEVAFRKYKEMADQLVDLEPSNVDWQIEVAYGNHNMGDVLLRGLNKPSDAVPYLENAAVAFQNAYEARPDSMFLKRYVAAQYLALADAHRQFGNVSEVIVFREKQKQVLLELQELAPKDQKIKEHLWMWYWAEGWLQTVLGNLPESLEQYEKAAAILRDLLKHEPNNDRLKLDSAILGFYQAENLLRTNNLKQAHERFQSAKKQSDSVLLGEKLNSWQRIYLQFLGRSMELMFAGSGEARTQKSRMILREMEPYILDLKKVQRGRWLVAKVFHQRIGTLIAEGDFEAAIELKEQLWRHLDGAEHTKIPSLLILLQEVVELVGDKAQQQRIRQTLIDRGYGQAIGQVAQIDHNFH